MLCWFSKVEVALFLPWRPYTGLFGCSAIVLVLTKFSGIEVLKRIHISGKFAPVYAADVQVIEKLFGIYLRSMRHYIEISRQYVGRAPTVFTKHNWKPAAYYEIVLRSRHGNDEHINRVLNGKNIYNFLESLHRTYLFIYFLTPTCCKTYSYFTWHYRFDFKIEFFYYVQIFSFFSNILFTVFLFYLPKSYTD